LARELARHRHAAYLRLDTIEHGLSELCGVNVQGEGYRLSYRIAADNLLAGNDVVADCCNPWELTRAEWEGVACGPSARFENIEIVCSEPSEHRRRVESRESDIPGFKLPDWENVQARQYEAWTRPVIRIETAGRAEADCLDELLRRIDGERR
jgi:predicted kinase